MMITDVTAPLDPQLAWQEKALAALDEIFGEPLDLWTTEKPGGWTLVPRQKTNLPASDFRCQELLELASEQGTPCALEVAPGQHWLAIPLAEPNHTACRVATALLESDAPQLLIQMAKVSQRYFQQDQQITQLREENDFFLKQVSHDFEELTLLRHLAECLGLGNDAHDLAQLIQESVQKLGEAIEAASLHFVERLPDAGLQVTATWNADNPASNLIDNATVEQLVEDFQLAAQTQPVIKNHFHTTPEAAKFPGVRNFVLISVATTMNPVGWFVAVNHRKPSCEEASLPAWQLSQHEFGTNEASLLCTAAAMLASHANNLALFREREVLLVNVVRSLVSAIDAKDPYTCGHSERVALYSKRLARHIGYDDEACELIYLTGLLHDVGKIAVSDAVLKKEGRLTKEEFAEIQLHPDEGWAILQGLKQLEYVLPGVLHHHERWDGGGYPDRLAKEDIPLDGRVLAVVDAYDAMTSDRAYRKGMSQQQAEKILHEGAGTQWDAQVVDAFFEILPEIAKIRENYQPRERPVRQVGATQSSV